MHHRHHTHKSFPNKTRLICDTQTWHTNLLPVWDAQQHVSSTFCLSGRRKNNTDGNGEGGQSLVKNFTLGVEMLASVRWVRETKNLRGWLISRAYYSTESAFFCRLALAKGFYSSTFVRHEYISLFHGLGWQWDEWSVVWVKLPDCLQLAGLNVGG